MYHCAPPRDAYAPRRYVTLITFDEPEPGSSLTCVCRQEGQQLATGLFRFVLFSHKCGLEYTYHNVVLHVGAALLISHGTRAAGHEGTEVAAYVYCFPNAKVHTSKVGVTIFN